MKAVIRLTNAELNFLFNKSTDGHYYAPLEFLEDARITELFQLPVYRVDLMRLADDMQTKPVIFENKEGDLKCLPRKDYEKLDQCPGCNRDMSEGDRSC